jgi:hypothetical protein
MKIDLNAMTRRFLLGEGIAQPTQRGYVESVIKILNEIRPKSQKESRQLEVAKKHLHEIKLMNLRLEKKVKTLEEQVKLLEEGN